MFFYKGKRIQLYYQYLDIGYTFLFSFPSIAIVVGLCWANQTEIGGFINGNQQYQQQFIFFGLLGLILVLTNICIALSVIKQSKLKGGYFSRLQRCQWLLKYLVENSLVDMKKKKTENGSQEVIQTPNVYYRRKNSLDCFTFKLGGKHHKEFLLMGSVLEELFLGDLVEVDRVPMFVTYKLLLDTKDRRMSIREVKAKDGSIELMKDVFWDYDKMPNLLISGGIGGGKTYFIYTLIKTFMEIGTVKIADPKRSDLGVLAELPAFKGHVVMEKEEIFRLLEDSYEMMIKRYKYMREHQNYTMGKNYAFYEMPPYVVIIDEWAAYYSTLDYKESERVLKVLMPLILQGRQAGVYMIIALQRPDAQNLPNGLRDNLLAKVSLGRLSELGYKMTYGDDNKNKSFVNKSGVGRGYLDIGKGIPQELYSPFVPDDFDFLTEFAKFDRMIELDFDAMRITKKDQEMMNAMYNEKDELQTRKLISEEYQKERQERLNQLENITIE
ncbi:FtsK/SpoIIIE domain-containing protein [Enterococcus sp. DIV0187]|uniref:FtsK/SpoIIIE domain-containing protein n=1 Tax=Enterococcus sp. DIV0187 TaxID=2774644 RepID=UPI003F688207